ncbi:diguanylate cyclase [Herbaspirillum sp. RTI4]|uniref:GGDEF domain-containing protein n=1 Tax=Herbaspirillum sp. RTI4 TaxID=3048640 RepID=UPI002AB50959|nr:diguanylate cyclase [Herbaspirillum sp. RTI4]MDY7578209.1 diguanylate cyclase [Herbaspirillum sp. RTI4]MEA9981547.1 diguanylate cyclase [Herbaspirillum sp. RTI4]
MSLTRLFWLISFALMSLCLLLTAGLVATQWGSYKDGAASINVIDDLRLSLKVMELISVERGPANSLLGTDRDEAPEARLRLSTARSNSDQAIKNMLDAMQAAHRADYQPVIANILSLREELTQARLNVDRLAAMPLTSRSAAAIKEAVDSMIALIRHSLQANSDLSVRTLKVDPSLRDGIDGVRLAAHLREYAGQIGSKFTGAVAAHRPLQSSEIIDIAKLEGRAEQMREILALRRHDHQSSPAIQAALLAINTEYFNKGLPMLNGLIDIGLQSGNYGITTSQLAQRYVPTMKSILNLRDLLLSDTRHEAEIHVARAKQALAATIGIGTLSLLIFYVLLRTFYRRIITPVLESTNLFVSLANGELHKEIPRPTGVYEISNLFRAMEAFKASCIARVFLEEEREALITQLQNSSDTDFLTGLLNRRAFFLQGEQIFATAQRYGTELSLILMDIDHFKQVNDDHGHQNGDEVLKHVAELCRLIYRKSDIVVRYGGEEFLMLLPHTSLIEASHVAEKVRQALMTASIQLVSGDALRVSASFGVAEYNDDSSLDILIWRADQALYQAKNNGRNQVQEAALTALTNT